MSSVTELILERTVLTLKDAKEIEDLARHLQLIADVSKSDVFIDCPTADNGSALVVAQAHPHAAPSLYKTSVVGQLAYAENEPAVLFCLVSGRPLIGSRGISQERIAMQQSVVPIRSKAGGVIGALIMERDITEQIEQEKNVERLIETNEQLGETLLSVAISEGGMQSLMHEGFVLFDETERVTYTNPRACGILQEIGHSDRVVGCEVSELFFGRLNQSSVLVESGFLQKEFQIGSVTLEMKAVSIIRDSRAVGGFMLIRDISDLKEKEKQLIIKSAVIKEIHHRVKNNLQTVSSLLRLQMRRTKHAEVGSVYRDSINRINSIAIIHEMLAFDGLDTIVFNDVADRIAKNVISSTAGPDQAIRANVTGDELVLPSDMATTLALAVNELVLNSVIHGFADKPAGDVGIGLKVSGRSACVWVTDNGIGMEASGPGDGKSHLGLKITETLVQENLNGIINIVTGRHGTVVQITFPLSS